MSPGKATRDSHHTEVDRHYKNPLIEEHDDARTDLLSSGLRTWMLTVTKANTSKKNNSIPNYAGLQAKTINSCRKVSEFHHDLPLHLPLAAKDGKAHKVKKDDEKEDKKGKKSKKGSKKDSK